MIGKFFNMEITQLMKLKVLAAKKGLNDSVLIRRALADYLEKEK